MKSETTSQIGILDALTAGLALAARRPGLVLIPLMMDLALWLLPRLTVAGLLARVAVFWEALVRATYTASQLAQMSDMLTGFREGVTKFSNEVNVVEALAGGWLGPPSAVAQAAATRLTFVSDMVLAPLGVGLDLPRLAVAPWQGSAIEVGSWWTVIALTIGGWLVSQLLATLYLRWAASVWQAGRESNPPGEDPWAGGRGYMRLALRLMILSLALGLLVFLLRLPLGAAVTMMLMSGGGGATALFVFAGGMTLWLLMWFLASLFFASEAIVLDRQPVLKGIWQSVILVRMNSWRTLGLVLIINIVLLGFRAVWGLIGRTPVGAIVGILGNAYLTTGLLLGVFTYYDELRRQWQVLKEKVGRQVNKEAGRQVDKE